MKIGIVTWFRHENYGTALQAFALQEYIKNMGYDVSLLNFSLDDRANTKKDFCYYRNRVIYKFDILFHRSSYETRSGKFAKFIADGVKLTNKISNDLDYISTCNSFDLLIFGSDQIWNPNWYHKYYFADDDAIKTRRASYAPSFGVSEINRELRKTYARSLARFQNITVRELNGAEIVNGLVGDKVKVVVDPTLLLDADRWKEEERKPKNIPKKYIACYFLSDNSKHWKAAKRFSKMHGLPLVVLPNAGTSCIRSKYFMRDSGPREFLYIIRNADYVITDSFHGTIFSTIFKKQVAVFERHKQSLGQSQNSRLFSFNKLLDGGLNIISYDSGRIEEKKIDYGKATKKLEHVISKSKAVLRNMIEGKSYE